MATEETYDQLLLWAVKGKANLTAGSFCSWIDEELLPNETLEPGFPMKVSVETARIWMHEMGFMVLVTKKGTFVDGHERDDVVQYQNLFLERMITLGFLNSSNAPSEEAKTSLPDDRSIKIKRSILHYCEEVCQFC